MHSVLQCPVAWKCIFKMYPIWDEMFMDFKWFDEKEPQPRYKTSAD